MESEKSKKKVEISKLTCDDVVTFRKDRNEEKIELANVYKIKRDNISATFQTLARSFYRVLVAPIVTRCRDYIRNLGDRG